MRTERIAVRLRVELLTALDEVVPRGAHPNQAAAFASLRQAIAEEPW